MSRFEVSNSLMGTIYAFVPVYLLLILLWISYFSFLANYHSFFYSNMNIYNVSYINYHFKMQILSIFLIKEGEPNPFTVAMQIL